MDTEEVRSRGAPGLGHGLVTNADVVVGSDLPRIRSRAPLMHGIVQKWCGPSSLMSLADRQLKVGPSTGGSTRPLATTARIMRPPGYRRGFACLPRVSDPLQVPSARVLGHRRWRPGRYEVRTQASYRARWVTDLVTAVS